MQYINPFELLNLTADNLASVDSIAVSKAKRNLLNEIELDENNSIKHNGSELTKADCLRAIDDLDSRDKKEFHYFIYQNGHLNKFLTSGTLSFFDNYQVESIYKLPAFLDFVSPFFCEKYDKILLENYKKGNLEIVSKILSVKPITSETYQDKCYKSTYAFLRTINSNIERIKKDIENDEKNGYSSFSISQKFKGLAQEISGEVNVQLLNILPAYFQSVRNQIALSIRDIEVKLYNDPYNNYITAFKLIEFAKNINSDGLALQTITKSYYTVKKQFEKIQTEEEAESSTVYECIHCDYESETDFKYCPKCLKDDNGLTLNEANKLLQKKQTTKETKAEKKSYAYWIFCCTILGVGFFYAPIQKIILGFSLLILLFPLWAIYKKTEFSLSFFLKNNFLFIAAASLGFYFSLIAQLYISYYFLVYLKVLYDEIAEIKKEKEKKDSFAFLPYLIGAIFITFLYHSYYSSFENKKENEQVVVKNDLPKTPEEFYQKGITLGKESDFKNAIDNFQKAISLNPNYFDAYLASAFYKTRVEDFQGVIDDCNKANTLKENNADVYNYGGYAKYRLKQLDEAMKDFNKAIEINPQYANAYRNRGEIKYDRNDNKGAVKDYSLAIQYDPQNPAYRFARGLAYFYLKDYNKALIDMNKAIELNPNVPQYYYDRGDTREKSNDLSGACSDWNIAKSKGYSVPEYKLNMCIPKVVSLENGNIAGCNFRPTYASPAIENHLKIKVGNTDVAVKLINIETEKCVRYVFINQYTTYSISNIPEGRYYMKIAYGEDWAKTSRETNCQGRFTKNTLFKKSDKILDFNLVQTATGWQVPYYELELKVVVTQGNDFNQFNSSSIAEDDFYKE